MSAPGRLCAEIRTDFTVYRDATGRDQLVTMPSRSNTSSGKIPIETQGRAYKVRSLQRIAPQFNFVTLVTLLTAFAGSGLDVRLCFWQADDFLAVLPLTALLQKFNALETF
jgi:hypothetical protein